MPCVRKLIHEVNDPLCQASARIIHAAATEKAQRRRTVSMSSKRLLATFLTTTMAKRIAKPPYQYKIRMQEFMLILVHELTMTIFSF